jgi:hypothetical protein
MSKRLELPSISDAEATPLVRALVAMIERQAEEIRGQKETIQKLRDEIAVLKGEKGQPKMLPSRLDARAEPALASAGAEAPEEAKRPGSAKRSKTAELTIHEERVIPPSPPPPPNARFKGYRDFVVQDLRIAAHNTRYRLEVWQTPSGEWSIGELPVELEGQHAGSTLRSYILYQHHHCHVTQPLLREQLREWGIDLSAGQIDAMLTGGKEGFFAEKDGLLTTGLAVSPVVTVDDSGARHQGQNGYVTHIGNDDFAWFASTAHKSRINFLELLHAGTTTYCINDTALDYLRAQGLPQAVRQRLQTDLLGEITSRAGWEQTLDTLGIATERHRRIATEGALMGGLLETGFNPELAIISDGAGQFAILRHGLCWVHAERLVHKLIPLNEPHRVDIARVRGQIWALYADLKVYRERPDPNRIAEYETRFDAIFTQRTSYETLNRTLKRLHAHKDELLLVLKRPEVVLHTNGSETDIRDFVKKRKVSGGTRSDLGRRCRDTFASLKKTCRKLGISFWDYLQDRLSQTHRIPPLPDIVRQRALAAPGLP